MACPGREPIPHRSDVAIAYVIQYVRRGGHVHNAMRPLGGSTVRSWLAQIVTKNTSVIQYQRDEFTAYHSATQRVWANRQLAR